MFMFTSSVYPVFEHCVLVCFGREEKKRRQKVKRAFFASSRSRPGSSAGMLHWNLPMYGIDVII